ncbi:hypothetical protein VTL71DRAFT_9724 [Oculimacula yallundae]|uniref:Cytochrome b-c1 complex subunit 8 n=1 Tax=Oculimacula yallundae TaxID=86028 RepID=A0ABR4BRP1_9HELO
MKQEKIASTAVNVSDTGPAALSYLHALSFQEWISPAWLGRQMEQREWWKGLSERHNKQANLPVLCPGHGKLPKQTGIITFRLSANRQRPLAGTLRAAAFNVPRRCRDQFLYVVPPFVAAYMLLDWAEKKNAWLNSKEGRLATREVET